MSSTPTIVCRRCKYDLAGHHGAGPITCPECGQTDTAYVDVHTPAENDAVVARVTLAILAAIMSYCVMANDKVSGAVACIFVGISVAGAISARRHARGSNRFLANVVFILVGVYTVLCFAAAIALRWR